MRAAYEGKEVFTKTMFSDTTFCVGLTANKKTSAALLVAPLVSLIVDQVRPTLLALGCHQVCYLELALGRQQVC